MEGQFPSIVRMHSENFTTSFDSSNVTKVYMILALANSTVKKKHEIKRDPKTSATRVTVSDVIFLPHITISSYMKLCCLSHNHDEVY